MAEDEKPRRRKGLFQRLRTSPLEEDRERLDGALYPGAIPVGDLRPRVESVVVGEVRDVRIVPRFDGARWLEATVQDGTGEVSVMWTGRTSIAGVRPGQRIKLSGRWAPTKSGPRLVITNPIYELL